MQDGWESSSPAEYGVYHEQNESWQPGKVETIPRSREVGQSYLTSVATTLVACFFCFYTVWKHKPTVVCRAIRFDIIILYVSTSCCLQLLYTCDVEPAPLQWTWDMRTDRRCFVGSFCKSIHIECFIRYYQSRIGGLWMLCILPFQFCFPLVAVFRTVFRTSAQVQIHLHRVNSKSEAPLAFRVGHSVPSTIS